MHPQFEGSALDSMGDATHLQPFPHLCAFCGPQTFFFSMQVDVFILYLLPFAKLMCDEKGLCCCCFTGSIPRHCWLCCHHSVLDRGSNVSIWGHHVLFSICLWLQLIHSNFGPGTPPPQMSPNPQFRPRPQNFGLWSQNFSPPTQQFWPQSYFRKGVGYHGSVVNPASWTPVLNERKLLLPEPARRRSEEKNRFWMDHRASQTTQD